MKKNKKKYIFLLNGEQKENIIDLLNHIKKEVTYDNKLISLNIAIDRIADITEDNNIVDTIAEIIIERIKGDK